MEPFYNLPGLCPFVPSHARERLWPEPNRSHLSWAAVAQSPGTSSGFGLPDNSNKNAKAPNAIIHMKSGCQIAARLIQLIGS